MPLTASVLATALIVLSALTWLAIARASAARRLFVGASMFALTTAGRQVPPDRLNTIATGLFLLACAGIALLIWRARTMPRVGQVLFLVIAAFLLTNKVYSPQYVLWLLPFVVLARPRWRDWLIWSAVINWHKPTG
mgnify:CR=1 FL=1